MTLQEHNDWLEGQVGQTCAKHNTIIKMGKFGLWCGRKDELGDWCAGVIAQDESAKN